MLLEVNKMVVLEVLEVEHQTITLQLEELELLIKVLLEELIVVMMQV